MTTSLKTFSSYQTDSESTLTRSDKAYFRARTRKHVHDVVVGKFIELVDGGRMSKAKVARRLDVHPSQVTRWLASPGNWTIDTISDLLLAMNCQASIRAEELVSEAKGNYFHELSSISETAVDVDTENRERSKVVVRFGDSHDTDLVSTS